MLVVTERTNEGEKERKNPKYKWKNIQINMAKDTQKNRVMLMMATL